MISVQTKKEKRKSRISYKKLLLLLLILTVIIFSLLKSFYFIKGLMFKTEIEEDRVRSKVAKIINTKGEDSKVYKIKETQPLKDKSTFYADVIEGDFVLVYNTSQKVVIYREKENLIINYSSSLGI